MIHCDSYVLRKWNLEQVEPIDKLSVYIYNEIKYIHLASAIKKDTTHRMKSLCIKLDDPSQNKRNN